MAGTGMSPDVLGALLFDQLKNQGMSDEDAHRAAQAAVTQAFGPQGPTNTWDVAGVSAAGATGSANPAPNAPGPKLPPPSQMAANRFKDKECHKDPRGAACLHHFPRHLHLG